MPETELCSSFWDTCTRSVSLPTVLLKTEIQERKIFLVHQLWLDTEQFFSKIWRIRLLADRQQWCMPLFYTLMCSLPSFQAGLYLSFLSTNCPSFPGNFPSANKQPERNNTKRGGCHTSLNPLSLRIFCTYRAADFFCPHLEAASQIYIAVF